MDYESTLHSRARRAPPMRTGISTARDGSPPRTPIRYDSPRAAKGTGASQALRVRSPSPRETFLDDITPIDNNRHAENEGSDRRDSHDLSISSRQGARESLVDNMLLSFDQLSMFVPPSSIDEERHFYDDQSSPRTIFTRNGRQRGHTYSSSYSSEIDHADDTSSRHTKLQGHSRRSNSSSVNHQGSIGRIDSLRAEGSRGRFFESQRASPASSRSHYSHSRGSKGSKGSTIGSTDLGYGQAVRGNPWTNDSNLDNSYGERMGYNSQSNMASNNPSDDECYQPMDYQDYEAAPTPTVPVGPRRRPQSPPPHSPPLAYAVYPPQPSHPPPQTPHLERKRSTKSSKSLYNRAGRSETIGGASTRTHTDSFGDVSDPRELPPLPAFVNPPAPSPSVPFEKPILPQPQPPVKERQGFFRRVFGSSKNSSPQPSPLVQSENMSSRAREHQHIVEQMIRPSTKSSPVASAENTPPLNKKHSFFRRRKKSFSENTPLPVPPLQVQQHQAVRAADAAVKAPDANTILTSPRTSLRRVMDPYLTSPGGHVEEYQPYWRDDQYFDSEETQSGDNAGKSPGHFSHDKPTIRAVGRSREGSEAEQSGRGIGANFGGPHARAHGGTSQARGDREDSFLQDNSSGNEGRTGKTPLERKPSNLSYQEDERRPRTSPASPTYHRMIMQEDEERELRRMPAVKTILAASPDPASVTLPVSPPPRNGSTAEEPAGLNLLVADDKKPSVGLQIDSAERPWLAPASPSDRPALSPQLSLPMEGPRQSQRASDSTNSDYKSASSLPVVQIDGEVSPSIRDEHIGEDESEPTADDRDRAKKIYDGNEEIISKARAAAWLGESGIISLRARKAYMRLYDWSNMNILAAMRVLCGRLILKGETQQVDRIIDAFAHRWCECNPNHGFKHVDVVHTICYSLLLLNTDLHLADIDKKMTRAEFLKNTVPTVVRVASDSAPGSFSQTSQNIQKRSSFLPSRSNTSHADYSTTDLRSPPVATFPRGIGEVRKEGSSSIDVAQSDRNTALAQLSTPDDDPPPTPQQFDTNESGPLVKEPFHGTAKQWECQIEIVLKEFFNSIRQQRLPLHGASTERVQDPQNHTLSVFGQGQAMLRRSPSVLSKAPSESFVSTTRGRHEAPRPGTGRWNTKNRSRPRLYPSSNVGSSRTSLDDQSSIWSPSVSSTWSKYSLNKTQTSMSVDSFGSNYPQGDYQQSIGFANALSQAIIREEAPGSSSSLQDDSGPLLDSDQLELAGAPWAKEGILKHKHHLESVDKKAKNRNWTESFAVIERGWMRLFSFSSKSSSKSRQQTGGVVGGGNWTENAEALGSFLLRQTIASALPPPGYSKARPHVWALSLPTGAVHLFQVGTPEIVKEFVSTANYWSARLSKEPLVGGISNVEYGWSDMVVNLAITQLDSHPSSPIHTRTRSTSTTGPVPRPSLQSSIRSSMEQGSMKPRLPGDKVMIADWSPPQQSMMASQLHEKDQLHALSTYVKNIEDELQKHNELRGAMLLAFSPRHPNSAKAMANWERKSSYLLREIVKFRTYIDCLTAAQREKEKVLKGREDSATSAASAAAAVEALASE